jgi:hypothetical protein
MQLIWRIEKMNPRPILMKEFLSVHLTNEWLQIMSTVTQRMKETEGKSRGNWITLANEYQRIAEAII